MLPKRFIPPNTECYLEDHVFKVAFTPLLESMVCMTLRTFAVTVLVLWGATAVAVCILFEVE